MMMFLWLSSLLLATTTAFAFVPSQLLSRQSQIDKNEEYLPPSLSFVTSLTSSLTSLSTSTNDDNLQETTPTKPNINTNTKTNTKAPSMLTNLLSRFQGDFDNYNQVYKDRSLGLTPREGGGHEHFHCTLISLVDFPGHRLLDGDGSGDGDSNSSGSKSGSENGVKY